MKKKYLKYTIGLLLIALLLSSVGVWFYMQHFMMNIVTNQYGFLNEKAGLALENLYQKSDKALEECIMYSLVQKSLKTEEMSEVDKSSLSKYFAYVDLDSVSEYCYVDNKKNLYTRSYSKIFYQNFENSGLAECLGDSYADTVWFTMKDELFGTGEHAQFIGRKVHSLDYAHAPGYLFFKMEPNFLDIVKTDEGTFTNEAAMGVMDREGNICMSRYPEGFEMTDAMVSGLMATGSNISNGQGQEKQKYPEGLFFVYRQKQTGYLVFTIVPNSVLSKETRKIVAVLLGIYLLVILAAVVFSVYFSDRITKPIQVLNKAMTDFDGNDFNNTVHLNTNTELDQIGNSYNEMLHNIKVLLEEVKNQEKELRTSELNMLISQINPHFLYNTLDNIYMLARINKEETTMKMIQALTKYLRLSLSKGSDIVTVEDELENVKSYMQIQQIRNDNLFTYTIDCRVEQDKTRVLKLILQPLVENAIKYGFCQIYQGGVIEIRVYLEEGELVFSVYNSGVPIDREIADRINSLNQKPLAAAKECFPDKKNGYGVVNVLTRLRLKYGDGVSYRYYPEENGTTCVIRIPEEGK